MEWTQLISLAGYTTAVCYFFYRLNEKSIDKLEKSIENNESHWREMFMHMNARIDSIKENK